LPASRDGESGEMVSRRPYPLETLHISFKLKGTLQETAHALAPAREWFLAASWSAPSIAVGIEGRVISTIRRMPMSGSLSRLIRWLRVHMTDEWWIAVLATTLSIGSYAWYDAHGFTFAFFDARFRELIARRVVASRTPGLAQFGVTWLPLTSILMLPLIWNDTLFRAGIAASLPSMLAYVVASVYLYRIGRLVTSSRGAGWVAAGALMLNPSFLYMQTTAMSETASISAFVVSIYYSLRLTRTYHAADLVKCAAAVAVGSLIRYENWVIAIALVPILAYAGWRHRGYVLAEAWTILYGLLAFAGCAAWILYNLVIFHDPLLSFFYGQSSHTYYANFPDSALPARNHPWLAFEMYGYTVVGTVGWILAAMALLGLILFIWRVRLRLTLLPIYLTLVPFGFYWLVLYRGVNTVSLPEFGGGSYYNVRFGLIMIPAVALFLAFLTMAVPVSLRRAFVAVALAIITLSSITSSTLQTPFVEREAQVFLNGAYGGQITIAGDYGPESWRAGQIEAQWFSSHYRGGNVLITYHTDSSLMFSLLTEHDFPDRVFITDTNGGQFADAVEHPETSVTWIVMNSDATDGATLIWTKLHNREDWRQYFVLRQAFGTMQIYERSALTTNQQTVTTGG
jgi:Dolichyl-phosphate-mannose-protein mannosyltransferase